MTEGLIQNGLLELMKKNQDLGVFAAMFLESSIIPIPSEAIIIGAGAIGIPLVSIIIFASLGSTLGGMVGYLLGRYGAKPLLMKYGKFIMVKPHHIQKAENFAKKYGIWSVLIGRLLPVVPFKIFSIAAGITRISLVPFVICTMIGVVPRVYVLALFGVVIMKYKKFAILALLAALLVYLGLKRAKAYKRLQKEGEVS